MTDVIVVGAGFSGAVIAERCAKKLGLSVLIIDKRNHLAGNCFDFTDDSGVLIHKYGPHIFHTAHETVWRYLSEFTTWHPYEHKVLASVDDKLIPVPFNLNSLNLCFGDAQAQRLERALLTRYGENARVPILELRQTGDPELKVLAEFIYEKVFVNYTAKQWGVTPENISPEVTARVPVVISRDDRYFQDNYQAIPSNGYTALIKRMLEHEKIKIRLGVNAMSIIRVDSDMGRIWVNDKPFDGVVVYTGMLDELFHYKYGELEYRSLQFQFENHATNSFQPLATVNYPNDHEFTRITEFKKLTGQQIACTTIVKEFPQNYSRDDPDKNIPYYPMMDARNESVHRQYKQEAEQFDNLITLGRLADFKYYNMDDAVAKSLEKFVEIEAKLTAKS